MLSDQQWQPPVRLDLAAASSRALMEAIDKFREHFKDVPLPPFTLTSGWHDVTPQMAEEMLRRNRGNRKVSLATVVKYAQMMTSGQWKPTGQAILFNTNGELEDAQHRLWACFFSGHSFPSYVVADVPVQDDLFAFLDDCKPRAASDALYTAGLDGLSTSMAAAIKIAWRYDHKALRISPPQPDIRNPTPMEVIEYARSHPELAQVAHQLMGTYSRAVRIMVHKGVGVFSAWKIVESYGHDALDKFMVPLGSGANLGEGNPILALRDRLAGVDDEDKMPVPQRLALIIKGFKLHHAGATVGKRGLFLRDNEKFPQFEELPAPAETPTE